MTKEEVLKISFRRMFVCWQLYRSALQEIQQSDCLKECATAAKVARNKNYVDIRQYAGDQMRTIDASMLRLKMNTMRFATWDAIIKHLNGEQLKELSILIDQCTDLSPEAIEKITADIITFKEEALKCHLNKETNEVAI